MNIVQRIMEQVDSKREQRGYSNEQLAKWIGVTRPTLDNWRKGSHDMRVALFYRIVYILDLDPKDFGVKFEMEWTE